ncbi:MAG: choice-of-anchor V domain-containing protein [Blastocatellia bacterium]
MPTKEQVKATFLTLFFVGLLLLILTGGRTITGARASAVGPNAGSTGAPGELTCAVSGCHGGEPNTGPGKLMILAPAVYEAGKSYEIMVKHMTTDGSRRRWGFQLTALDGTNNKTGELVSTSSLTQIIPGGPGGNREYIEHGFLGTFQGQRLQASWTFNWVAPASDAGPVTFYAAGNEANNDGNNTGDQIYVASAVINASAVVSGPPVIKEISISGKKLFVMGENFGLGAELLMDGARVKKTFNDEVTPNSLLIAKKAGKTIQPGQTVVLQVRNPDGSLSDSVSFTRL